MSERVERLRRENAHPSQLLRKPVAAGPDALAEAPGAVRRARLTPVIIAPTRLTPSRRPMMMAAAACRMATNRCIDATCACEVCARHSRGYIRHLFQVGEPTANRLLSIHNVAWTIQLMARMRAAIADGTFDALRREVLAVWG